MVDIRSLKLTLLCMFIVHMVERPVAACTSILVTKGASSDGSTFLTYAADSIDLYGELYYTPAGHHPASAMRDIYDWDTGKHLGQIRQTAHTFAVVGNMNEHQVVIGESTFGGREELKDPGGRIDYGSLIYIVLQRARTARDAIRIMDELVSEYGYASAGETFSIADPNEAWIMEMVGKGPKRTGSVWVARRVPDGYITAHANQARIRQFPMHDPTICLYAKDVVSFAREKGWFRGSDESFSFADTYAPLKGQTLRTCQTRIWSAFRRVAPSANLPTDYAKLLDSNNPLPLFIKPDRRLTLADTFTLMRDHFEGTSLDLTQGVGAGPHGLPDRWRPLKWKVDETEYINERPISTQQTGFSFVAQVRAHLPDPIGGVLWFGVDDTYSTVYVPMYCGIRESPRAFASGTATFQSFSWESAFWVFNFVSNYSYLRYRDMIRDVQMVQQELESSFFARQAEVETTALQMHKNTPDLARDYLTRYSAQQAQLTVNRWRQLGESLIVKYLDGNVRDEHGHVNEPGYAEQWYRRTARDCGARCRIPTLPENTTEEPPPPREPAKPLITPR